MTKVTGKILVVLIGATGNIGDILCRGLERRSQMKLVTCGHRAGISGHSHIYWDFDSEFPSDMVSKYELEDIFLVNASIAWPSSLTDVESSLRTFDKICGALPGKKRLIHISSMSAGSNSLSFYAALKKEEEKRVLANRQVAIRVGIVDSDPAFGFKSLILKTSNLIRFVPVPFPAAKVRITRSEDIVEDVLSAILHPVADKVIHECYSWEGSFYDAIRKLLPRARLMRLHDYLCLGAARLVRFVANGSSLSQKIEGILALRQ